MAKNGKELAVDALVKFIREYESDTFSAAGSKLLKREAVSMAANLINQIEDHLDGVQLSEELDVIRGE